MQLLHKFAGGGGWQMIVRLQGGGGACPESTRTFDLIRQR